MGPGASGITRGGSGCPPGLPALPVHFCLQICALLFVSLYILCHFIITHFKKHTDFTAGRRAGAAGAGQPLAATFSLSGDCSSIAFGLPREPRSHHNLGCCGIGRCGAPPQLPLEGSRAQTPWEYWGQGQVWEWTGKQAGSNAPGSPASPSTISLGFFPPCSA